MLQRMLLRAVGPPSYVPGWTTHESTINGEVFWERPRKGLQLNGVDVHPSFYVCHAKKEIEEFRIFGRYNLVKFMHTPLSGMYGPLTEDTVEMIGDKLTNLDLPDAVQGHNVDRFFGNPDHEREQRGEIPPPTAEILIEPTAEILVD